MSESTVDRVRKNYRLSRLTVDRIHRIMGSNLDLGLPSETRVIELAVEAFEKERFPEKSQKKNSSSR